MALLLSAVTQTVSSTFPVESKRKTGVGKKDAGSHQHCEAVLVRAEERDAAGVSSAPPRTCLSPLNQVQALSREPFLKLGRYACKEGNATISLPAWTPTYAVALLVHPLYRSELKGKRKCEEERRYSPGATGKQCL